ncbi:hypothetical protein PHMEG_00030590, partial [Phytophthora megakarya]
MEHLLANEKRVHSKIRAHEILQCIGLLLARVMCPHIRRLSDHWATTSVGTISAAIFGRFMKRERFERLMRNLHFSDNDAARAQTDKAWKVRPIVDTLQRTFLSGYTTPLVISFDEAMVPSRSRYNPMRQFMKDKPHRWGTKLFMTCCAQSAYCLRCYNVGAEQTLFFLNHKSYEAAFLVAMVHILISCLYLCFTCWILEVYCGKSGQDIHEDEEPADDNSGPSATLRIMNAVLPQKEKRRVLRGGDRPILHVDPDSSTASRAERLIGGYHPDQEERLSYDAETKHIEAPEG